MSELHWQKSSFSGAPDQNCLNLATAPDGTLRLRESDTPATVISTAPETLAPLLTHLKKTE